MPQAVAVADFSNTERVKCSDKRKLFIIKNIFVTQIIFWVPGSMFQVPGWFQVNRFQDFVSSIKFHVPIW